MKKKSITTKQVSSKRKPVKLSESERVIADNAIAEIENHMETLARLVFKSLDIKSGKITRMRAEMSGNKSLGLKAGNKFKVKFPPITAMCFWTSDGAHCGCYDCAHRVSRPCTLKEATETGL